MGTCLIIIIIIIIIAFRKSIWMSGCWEGFNWGTWLRLWGVQLSVLVLEILGKENWPSLSFCPLTSPHPSQPASSCWRLPSHLFLLLHTGTNIKDWTLLGHWMRTEAGVCATIVARCYSNRLVCIWPLQKTVWGSGYRTLSRLISCLGVKTEVTMCLSVCIEETIFVCYVFFSL